MTGNSDATEGKKRCRTSKSIKKLLVMRRGCVIRGDGWTKARTGASSQQMDEKAITGMIDDYVRKTADGSCTTDEMR